MWWRPCLRPLRNTTKKAASLPGLPAIEKNCAALVNGMQALGFKPFLEASVQAPIIVTFHAPEVAGYVFNAFYAAVRERGFLLYPGKLTQIETFRVGCIGAIDHHAIEQAVHAIGLALNDLKTA